MSLEQMSVVFPENYGFCEGVAAADDLLRNVSLEAAQLGITTVYGYHEIVHNADVVAAHEARGVIFAEEIDEIPDGSVVVTSAHGVSPQIMDALERKNATVFDAACPLVIHTHLGAAAARRENEKVLYVCHGIPGKVDTLHDEVNGMVGHLDYTRTEGQLKYDPLERTYLELHDDPEAVQDLLTADKYRIITQTTLNSVEALRYCDKLREYILTNQPNAKIQWSSRGDVCRAVAVRQDGVEQLIQLSPARIVVATDPNSKNGMSYVELARKRAEEEGSKTSVHQVASVEEAELLGRVDGLTAITASASTPDTVTFAVAQALGMSSETPQAERPMFNLRDARAGVIVTKLALHANRQLLQGAI